MKLSEARAQTAIHNHQQLDDAKGSASESFVAIRNRVLKQFQKLTLLALYIIMSLLSLRGFFAIFEANPHSLVVEIINALTTPLIVPFKNVFIYSDEIFQVYILAAAATYLILGWAIVLFLEILKTPTDSHQH